MVGVFPCMGLRCVLLWVRLWWLAAILPHCFAQLLVIYNCLLVGLLWVFIASSSSITGCCSISQPSLSSIGWPNGMGGAVRQQDQGLKSTKHPESLCFDKHLEYNPLVQCVTCVSNFSFNSLCLTSDSCAVSTHSCPLLSPQICMIWTVCMIGFAHRTAA